jgi:hypothetical protein
MQEKRHTMKSFAAYADWVKSVHFCEPPPCARVRLPDRLLVARVNHPQSRFVRGSGLTKIGQRIFLRGFMPRKSWLYSRAIKLTSLHSPAQTHGMWANMTTVCSDIQAASPNAAQRPAGLTQSGRPERKRRMMSYAGAEPSVEEIEAEFWRIVETPDDVYESLYGQVRICRWPSVVMRFVPQLHSLVISTRPVLIPSTRI